MTATVVGGGISGVACAASLARPGIDVELLDRGRQLGRPHGLAHAARHGDAGRRPCRRHRRLLLHRCGPGLRRRGGRPRRARSGAPVDGLLPRRRTRRHRGRAVGSDAVRGSRRACAASSRPWPTAARRHRAPVSMRSTAVAIADGRCVGRRTSRADAVAALHAASPGRAHRRRPARVASHVGAGHRGHLRVRPSVLDRPRRRLRQRRPGPDVDRRRRQPARRRCPRARGPRPPAARGAAPRRPRRPSRPWRSPRSSASWGSTPIPTGSTATGGRSPSRCPPARSRSGCTTQANLGLAGDAWSGGPRVEAAWLSGHRLGAGTGHAAHRRRLNGRLAARASNRARRCPVGRRRQGKGDRPPRRSRRLRRSLPGWQQRRSHRRHRRPEVRPPPAAQRHPDPRGGAGHRQRRRHRPGRAAAGDGRPQRARHRHLEAASSAPTRTSSRRTTSPSTR